MNLFKLLTLCFPIAMLFSIGATPGFHLEDEIKIEFKTPDGFKIKRLIFSEIQSSTMTIIQKDFDQVRLSEGVYNFTIEGNTDASYYFICLKIDAKNNVLYLNNPVMSPKYYYLEPCFESYGINEAVNSLTIKYRNKTDYLIYRINHFAGNNIQHCIGSNDIDIFNPIKPGEERTFKLNTRHEKHELRASISAYHKETGKVYNETHFVKDCTNMTFTESICDVKYLSSYNEY